jgi:charged multivesicular body protein 1
MVMDQFEKQFEDIDVQTQYMENAMGNTTTMTTPQDEVDQLMQRVADENGLELKMDLVNVPGASAKAKTEEKDELSERLAKLRNG